MTKIIFYLTTFLFLFVCQLEAQETFESKVKLISSNIENITKEEKSALKVEVEAINIDLQNGKISKEEADAAKQKFAENRAKNIEVRVALEQKKLEELVQQKVDGKISGFDTIKKPNKLTLKWDKGDKDYVCKPKPEKRTTTQFVYAMGLNNLATDGNLENLDYRFLGSHFYEWGFTSNTRIFKNDNLLHLKYGWSVMYNNLRPTENRVFVKNGNETNLQTNVRQLDDSRFKNVYLVAPLHFEFDFSGNSEKDGKPIFKTHRSLRFGLGGYGGIRLKTKQILKYENEFGDNVKQKSKNDFNSSNYIYGLSTYLGYKETSLYVKYDLNQLFQNNAVKQNNVSLGVRFDFN